MEPIELFQITQSYLEIGPPKKKKICSPIEKVRFQRLTPEIYLIAETKKIYAQTCIEDKSKVKTAVEGSLNVLILEEKQ